jgi:transposase-like protein
MGHKRYTPEQIIGKLRQAEVRSAEGATVAEIVRELGITDQTYYRWRKEYGGLKVAQAKRLKELGASERRACRVLGQARSTQRRRASMPARRSRPG